MGKTRVIGKDVQVFLSDMQGNTLQLITEIDRFSAKNNEDLKKSRPLSETSHSAHTVHMGWDLDFEVGKVNWELSCFFQAQDQQLRAGGRSPVLRVVETIRHLDGSQEIWVFEDVSVFGYNVDVSSQTDEIKEKFNGYAKRRVAAAGTKSDAGVFGGPDGNTTVAAASVLSGLVDAAFGRFSGGTPQDTAGPVG